MPGEESGSRNTGIVAMSEDDVLAWVGRDDSKAAARRLVRDEYGEGGPLSDYHVTAAWMRPWSAEDDCTAEQHYVDTGDAGDCQCGYYLEEGWQMQCDRSHPSAYPVWRVEWIG